MSRANAEQIETTGPASETRPEDVDARLKPVSRALSYPSAAVQQHFREFLTRSPTSHGRPPRR